MLSNHRKPVLLTLKSSRTGVSLVELLRQLLKIRLRRVLKLLRLLRQRLKLLRRLAQRPMPRQPGVVSLAALLALTGACTPIHGLLSRCGRSRVLGAGVGLGAH